MLKSLTISIILILSIAPSLAGRKYNQFKQPQHIYENQHGTMLATEMIYKYLRLSTADTGVEMNVNGAGGSPKSFDFVMTDSDESILGAWITRINFVAMNAAMSADDFFGLTALSTGVTIKVYDTDLVTELLNFTPIPIKFATDFISLSGSDTNFINTQGGGDDASSIRWTLSKTGAPLFLLKGQMIRMTISDDLTGITQFRAMIQGIK